MSSESWVLVGGIMVVPFVSGLVRAVAVAWPGVDWSRWRPMLCIVVGVLLAMVAGPGSVDGWRAVWDRVILGVAVGLSAAGLYSGVGMVRNGNGVDRRTGDAGR